MAGQGTKKRWRIGGSRSKSKSKSKATKSDSGEHIKCVNNFKSCIDTTAHTTLESSDRSSSHESQDTFANDSDNSKNSHLDCTNDLPPAMSEVEDSDSDDDLYVDNDKNPKHVDEPQPISSDEDSVSVKQVAQNIEDDNDSKQSDDEFESLYENDMERHQMQRRNSPHFFESLSKITEEPPSSFEDEGKCDDGSLSNGDLEMSPQNLVKHVAPAESASVLYFDNDCEEEEEINLPSHKELSKELAKLIATEHYSTRESLLALERTSKWARTQDSNFLKHLLTFGGVVNVISFLDECLADDSCQGEILMECIHKAADVICNVCFVGKHGINEDIAVVNGTVVVKYAGVKTFLKAIDVYVKCSNKSDPMALTAIESLWNATMNVYCNAEASMTKEISMQVLDSAIATISSVGSIDHPIACETLANVFNSLYRITYHGFVTKEEFQDKNVLEHCLSIFQRDVTSSDGDEELLEEAFSFLYGCHEKKLLDAGTDYEGLLPLCVIGLQEFAHENDSIREWATKLLDGACSNVANKESIMMAEGAIEALAPLLTAKDVGADEKEELRELMRKILAPV